MRKKEFIKRIDELTTNIITSTAPLYTQLRGLQLSSESHREKINAIMDYLGVTARYVCGNTTPPTWVVEKKNKKSGK